MCDQTVSKEDEMVIIYIAGYVAHAVKKLKCYMCVSRISFDKAHEAELPKKCQYFKALDKGGLKWLTDFTLSHCQTARNGEGSG